MRYISCILLCASIACQSNDISEEDKERLLDIHVESAGAYLSLGDYGRAVDQALRGLKIDPDNFKLGLYLARGLQKTGLIGDVLRAEKVFRGLPRDKDYRVALGLGETVERRGIAQADAAEEVRAGLRFTEAADPAARADELQTLAETAWRESSALYGEALALAPGDSEILNGLVRAHTLLGEHETAISWGDRVIEVTESDRAWWTEALKRPGMSPREEAACRRSIQHLDRLECSVRLNSYTLLAGSSSFEEALVHLDRAGELDPTDSTIYSRRGELLIDLGRHAEALVAIDAFLSRTGENFGSEDVRRAFQLRAACEAALTKN